MRTFLKCLFVSTFFVSSGLLLPAGPVFAQTPVVVFRPEVNVPAAAAAADLEAVSKLLGELNYQVRWLNNSHDTLIAACQRNGLTVPVYVTLSADGRDLFVRSYLTKLDSSLAAHAPWAKMVETQETINPVQFSYVPSSGWLSMWYSIDNHDLTRNSLNDQFSFYVDNIFATRNLWDPNQWQAAEVAPAPAPEAPPAPFPKASRENTRQSVRGFYEAIAAHHNRCNHAMSVMSQDVADYLEGKAVDIEKLQRDQAECITAATALLVEANRMTAPSDEACRRYLTAYQDYCRWMLPRFSAVFANCTSQIVAAADLGQPGVTREAAQHAISLTVGKALAEMRERNESLAAAEKQFVEQCSAVASN